MTYKPKLLLVLLIFTAAAVQEDWRTARPGYQWSFPEDHWKRAGYKTEWWYFTGHLAAAEEPDHRFGYQFTLFRIGLRNGPAPIDSDWAAHEVIMGHAAVSDLATQKHVFSEVLYRATPLLGEFGSHPDPVIAWCRAPAGTEGKWTLSWNGKGFDFTMSDRVRGIALNLSTEPLKPLIFQGPNGYSPKGRRPGAASQYYSFTRLMTRGTLSVDGRTFQVQGQSWMDKEFGSNQLAENQVGWDWFSLQLEDGTELMLYRLRDSDGNTDFARGTRVSGNGEAHYLDPEDWQLEPTDSWKSPSTGSLYPSRWRVTLPQESLHLEVVPELADQENRGRLTPDLYYWEGAARVLDRGGREVGRGYVELTGYGARPPI